MNNITFLLRFAVFPTWHYAALCGTGVDAASRRLGRLAREGVVVRLTRGVWAQPEHPRFTPFAAVPLLVGHEHGYVSFLSALHIHGVISQIPGSIQVATTGHARHLDTPFARYEFLRIQPSMMREGICISATDPPYNIATAAKALLDTLYIATRKGRRFAYLPEVDLTEVDEAALHRLLNQQVPSRAIHRAIERRLAALKQVSADAA